MKLSCQEGLVPGATFAEKLRNLQTYGFAAVELAGAQLNDAAGLAERRAALKDSPVRASSICGGFAAEMVHPEIELLRHALADLAHHAEGTGSCLLLEPLNRYESNSLRDVEEAAELCRAIGGSGVRVMADFFHMHIEQPNTPKSFAAIADVLGHVHLADNTRKEPGSGDIDFTAAFTVLKKIGFTGYMAFECGLSDRAEIALPQPVAYLNSCLAAA